MQLLIKTKSDNLFHDLLNCIDKKEVYLMTLSAAEMIQSGCGRWVKHHEIILTRGTWCNRKKTRVNWFAKNPTGTSFGVCDQKKKTYDLLITNSLSKACVILDRSCTGIMDSNPTRGTQYRILCTTVCCCKSGPIIRPKSPPIRMYDRQSQLTVFIIQKGETPVTVVLTKWRYSNHLSLRCYLHHKIVLSLQTA